MFVVRWNGPWKYTVVSLLPRLSPQVVAGPQAIREESPAWRDEEVRAVDLKVVDPRCTEEAPSREEYNSQPHPNPPAIAAHIFFYSSRLLTHCDCVIRIDFFLHIWLYTPYREGKPNTNTLPFKGKNKHRHSFITSIISSSNLQYLETEIDRPWGPSNENLSL